MIFLVEDSVFMMMIMMMMMMMMMTTTKITTNETRIVLFCWFFVLLSTHLKRKDGLLYSELLYFILKPVYLTLCQAGTLGGHTGPSRTVSTGTHGLATTTGSCITVLAITVQNCRSM